MLGWVLAYRRRSALGTRRAGAFGYAVAVLTAAAVPVAACNVSQSTPNIGDSGLFESGSGGDGAGVLQDAGGCQPGDVQTYMAMRYRPATYKYRGVCTPAQIAGFYDACVVGASSGNCEAFLDPDASTGACAACILTPETASAYGPLIDHGGFITPNVGGCIELTDPNGLSCAKAQQALLGCQLAACEATCPVHDQAMRAQYDMCASTAAMGGCQAFAAKAACEADSGMPAACLLPTFQDFYYAVVPLFCGSPPPSPDAAVDGMALSDAGNDAASGDAASPSDASTDGPTLDGTSTDGPVVDAPYTEASAD
jgi:hypothetical protein